MSMGMERSEGRKGSENGGGRVAKAYETVADRHLRIQSNRRLFLDCDHLLELGDGAAVLFEALENGDCGGREFDLVEERLGGGLLLFRRTRGCQIRIERKGWSVAEVPAEITMSHHQRSLPPECRTPEASAPDLMTALLPSHSKHRWRVPPVSVRCFPGSF